MAAGHDSVVVAPGAGEIIGDSADRHVEILSDADPLHATWSRFGPGRDGADLHVHYEHTDLFYVLDGELMLRLGPGGDEVAVAAGELARMPPVVVHGFRNASDADVRYLNLHAPGRGFADYMRSVRDGDPITYDQHDPPANGGRPPSEAAIGERSVLVDDGPLRVDLLAETDEIAVAEVSCAAGATLLLSEGRPQHTESLYVLEGEVTLNAGDREIGAAPGTWVQLPAGTPHAVEFANGDAARFLVVQTPNDGLGALRALRAG